MPEAASQSAMPPGEWPGVWITSKCRSPRSIASPSATIRVAGARRTAEPTPDEGEDIAVHTVPRREIPGLIRRGRLTHSLSVAAFHLLDLRRQDS